MREVSRQSLKKAEYREEKVGSGKGRGGGGVEIGEVGQQPADVEGAPSSNIPKTKNRGKRKKFSDRRSLFLINVVTRKEGGLEKVPYQRKEESKSLPRGPGTGGGFREGI